MLTKEQALSLRHNDYIHHGRCTRIVGPRGGITTMIERYRVASQIKTWKTRPNDFQFTVRFGMCGSTHTVDNFNAFRFHTESECPLNNA